MRPLLLPLLPVLFLSACCFNTKCGDPAMMRVPIAVVSAAGGQNLVFGPSAVFEPDSIRCYTLSGADTINLDVWQQSSPALGGDSMLVLGMFGRVQGDLFLRLSAADTDTLRFSYENGKESRCCPSPGYVRSCQVNGGNWEVGADPVYIRKP